MYLNYNEKGEITGFTKKKVLDGTCLKIEADKYREIIESPEHIKYHVDLSGETPVIGKSEVIPEFYVMENGTIRPMQDEELPEIERQRRSKERKKIKKEREMPTFQEQLAAIWNALEAIGDLPASTQKVLDEIRRVENE
jgi:hypothetical protein